jgi:hypothetical protein
VATMENPVGDRAWPGALDAEGGGVGLTQML